MNRERAPINNIRLRSEATAGQVASRQQDGGFRRRSRLHCATTRRVAMARQAVPLSRLLLRKNRMCRRVTLKFENLESRHIFSRD